MVTKGEAMQTFFERFLPSYPAGNVPDEAKFPYLTYELVTGQFGTKVGIDVNLWYRCDSEAAPNAKADEISKAIGRGGTTMECEDGGLWICRGTPWCQNLYDPSDEKVKRRYLNIEVEYITAD